MLRHAARAVPWPLLAVTAALLALLLRIVAEWPYTMWPLEGIAVGLLAGVAGFAYDEPAAAIVDTLPRGLAWRTAARSIGVTLLVAWWLGAVSVTRDAYFGHAPDVAFQGVVAVLAVLAAAAHLRLRGHDSPATLLATGVVGAAAYLSLARPIEDVLVVFPYTEVGEWASSRTWWSALGAGALVVLGLALGERGTAES